MRGKSQDARAVEHSKIVIEEQKNEVEVVASTGIQVLEALRCRGLALDFADCTAYQKYLKNTQLLKPPGLRGLCKAQSEPSAQAADQVAWAKVIESNTKP